MENFKYHFTCINCGKKYIDGGVKYLCDTCSIDNSATKPPKGVLKVNYNYLEIKNNNKGKFLFEELNEKDFLDILPINSIASLSPLKVGKTPIYQFKSSSFISKNNNFDVIFKDDGLNPTFSHKDRASNLVSAYAKENNINTIVAASTGNAGSSIAGICASQKQKAIVMVPAKAPKAKLLQIMHYGAQIVPVDGTYDDAFELSLQVSKKFGFYNRNTAFNPFTIEGKKTVAFEIFDDLKQHLPDLIFVSVGDGVIISGMYKGFEDLMKLGIIDKMPQIVAVQSDKSKNLIANLNSEIFTIYPSETIADSISVDVPRNFYMAKGFIKKYNGYPILVSDDEIIEASQLLSKNTGIFSEPAAVASFAGFLKYTKQENTNHLNKVLILLTGCGLKDLKNIENLHTMPAAIKPDIEAYSEFLKKCLK